MTAFVREITIRLILLTMFFFTAAQASEPFTWLLDPETKIMTAQLTNEGNNYGFYWHQKNNTDEGRYLIYRNMTNSSVSTLNYYKLDLETGENVAIMPKGYANCAYVCGDHLYAFTRPDLSSSHKTLSRYDLGTLQKQDLVTVSGSLTGSMTINSDRTALIYCEYVSFLGNEINNIHLLDLTDNTHRLLFTTSDMTTRHFQFSLTDPDHYTYYDSGSKGIETLNVGNIRTNERSGLKSTDPYLLSVGNFAHAFYSADGHLWSDGIWSTMISGDTYVRFDIDYSAGNIGNITSYVKIPIANEQWQLHTTYTRAAGWFGGDGTGADRPAAGELYIHLLNLDVNTLAANQFRLARAIGTNLTADGNQEANNHVLQTQDAIVWSAYNSFTDNSQERMNIFLVKIPNKLKASLANAMVAGIGSAEGPFKHANRVTVDSAGKWKVSFGKPDGFDNAATNAELPKLSVDKEYTSYAMADIDGDDVDDRIGMLWDASQSRWTVDSVRMLYCGTKSEDNIKWQGQYTDLTEKYKPQFNDIDGDSLDDVVLIRPSGSLLTWSAIKNTSGELPVQAVWQGYNGNFGSSTLDDYAYIADVNRDGYADRVVVRKSSNGWLWQCDYSGAGGFGDGTVDTSYTGGDNLSDTPLMGDVNGDGFSDIVIARRSGDSLVWFANLSNAGGFDSKWTFQNNIFGGVSDQPLLGQLGRFTTVAGAVCGDLGYSIVDIGSSAGEGIRDCRVDLNDFSIFMNNWLNTL